MNILCVVAARGGSVRVPGKNLRTVLGKPLLWYTFENIRHAGLMDRCVMVTDDAAIADYSAKQGAMVVMEPTRTAATENGSRALAIGLHGSGRQCDVLVALQATAPLFSDDLIRRTIAALTDGCDAASSVTRARVPLCFMLQRTEDGTLTPLSPITLSQDQPVYYELSGCVTAYRPEVFGRNTEDYVGFHAGLKRRGVVHDDPHCDIDDEDDLLYLEYILRTGRYPWLSSL